jgi:uncharacterized protein YbjT (DUF2867 family)
MILVAGATGLVGTDVCLKLAQRGEKVRALVRTTSSPEKLDALQSRGVELCFGDLKDAASLDRACAGAEAVVSTESSTLSRQEGDSIESVDAAGQLSLVRAAKAAGCGRFVLVSFRRPGGFSFPLADAKRQVEEAIADMNFTVIQASWFMEVWLSPALGFNYVNGSVRIYGSGTSPVSWVSSGDVAEICAVAMRHPAAERQTIAFGGPEALSPLEVVERFEKISGRRFERDFIPDEALRAQYDNAEDSLQKTFAALMLGYASGDAIDMTGVIKTFSLRLVTVDEYAHRAMEQTVSA